MKQRMSLPVVLLLFSVPVAVWAFDISDVEIPPASRAVYVGDVVQNGVPTQMLKFSSPRSVTEVLAFYKNSWSDPGKVRDNLPPYIEKEAGEWRVLSKLEGSYSVAIQIRQHEEATGSEGFISVLDIGKSPVIGELAKQFPRQGGTELISSTESKDGKKRATTLIFVNGHTVESNEEFYRAAMAANDWKLVRGGVKRGVAVLLFNRRHEQCEISIGQGDGGESVIFANVVLPD